MLLNIWGGRKSVYKKSDYFIISGQIFWKQYNYCITKDDFQIDKEDLIKNERIQWNEAVHWAEKEKNTTNLSMVVQALVKTEIFTSPEEGADITQDSA